MAQKRKKVTPKLRPVWIDVEVHKAIVEEADRQQRFIYIVATEIFKRGISTIRLPLTEVNS